MNKNILHTKWGNARVNKKGYYQISSRKEGNRGKYLHRLIYESFWDVNLPKQIHIHHKNGDKKNNCILNLEALPESNHIQIHNSGKDNPFYGKIHTEKSKQQMSKSQKGKKFTQQHKINLSKSRTTTGFYRVSKHIKKDCNQGFTWRYTYYDNGKYVDIESVDIKKLEEKVKSKGLEWRKL